MFSLYLSPSGWRLIIIQTQAHAQKVHFDGNCSHLEQEEKRKVPVNEKSAFYLVKKFKNRQFEPYNWPFHCTWHPLDPKLCFKTLRKQNWRLQEYLFSWKSPFQKGFSSMSQFLCEPSYPCVFALNFLLFGYIVARIKRIVLPSNCPAINFLQR